MNPDITLTQTLQAAVSAYAEGNARLCATLVGRLLRWWQAGRLSQDDRPGPSLCHRELWGLLNRLSDPGLLARLPGQPALEASMAELMARAQRFRLAKVASEPSPEVRSVEEGVQQALQALSPHPASAEVLALLEQADDLLCLGTALAFLGRPMPLVLLKLAFAIARHAGRHPVPAVAGDIVEAAEAESAARGAADEPVGRYLWRPLLEPESNPHLVEELAALEQQAQARAQAAQQGREQTARAVGVALALSQSLVARVRRVRMLGPSDPLAGEASPFLSSEDGNAAADEALRAFLAAVEDDLLSAQAQFFDIRHPLGAVEVFSGPTPATGERPRVVLGLPGGRPVVAVAGCSAVSAHLEGPGQAASAPVPTEARGELHMLSDPWKSAPTAALVLELEQGENRWLINLGPSPLTLL